MYTNTTDSTGRKNSYLIPLLLSCFFPINIISLVTHPMNCVYDMPATAVLVSCYLNLFGFCLWGPTLNGGTFFVVFPGFVQGCFFVFIDLRYNMTPATEMNDRSLIEPEFLSFSFLQSYSSCCNIYNCSDVYL